MADSTVLNRAVSKLLGELVEGAAADEAWVLNREDPGLLRSLEKLSAVEASAVRPGGGACIAAHVDHLRYGLELLNRWSEGEEPFADANYSASWRRRAVSEQQWTELRGQLETEAHRWLEAARKPRDLSEADATGVVASVVHLAYHFGAIRQIDRSIRGPEARD